MSKLLTSKIQTKPCYHCDHLIDLQNDDFVRIDTLQSIINKKPKAYAHTMCESQARQQYAVDDAISDMMTDRELSEADYFDYQEAYDGIF